MKASIGLLATCVGVFAAFLLQQAIPPLNILHGARLIFVPLIFCLAAMALPFPLMLAAAFFIGFLCDLMYLHVVEGQVEIALGCSIVFFIIYGSIANGLRPSYRAGHWWSLVPMAGIGTAAYLLMQFVMISVRRGSFEVNLIVLWRVLAPGCIAALFAPILYVGVQAIDAIFQQKARRGRSC